MRKTLCNGIDKECKFIGKNWDLLQLLCDSIKYPYLPHGGSWKFLGVGGSNGDKFPKGRGVHKEFFFPGGLKCDRKKHLRTFLIDSGNQEKQRVLSVETDVKYLVIHFPLLFRHKTTHRALRHTSEQHVRCQSNKMADKKISFPDP